MSEISVRISAHMFLPSNACHCRTGAALITNLQARQFPLITTVYIIVLKPATTCERFCCHVFCWASSLVVCCNLNPLKATASFQEHLRNALYTGKVHAFGRTLLIHNCIIFPKMIFRYNQD